MLNNIEERPKISYVIQRESEREKEREREREIFNQTLFRTVQITIEHAVSHALHDRSLPATKMVNESNSFTIFLELESKKMI